MQSNAHGKDDLKDHLKPLSIPSRFSDSSPRNLRTVALLRKIDGVCCRVDKSGLAPKMQSNAHGKDVDSERIRVLSEVTVLLTLNLQSLSPVNLKDHLKPLSIPSRFSDSSPRNLRTR
jgi:hypothetical protein